MRKTKQFRFSPSSASPPSPSSAVALTLANRQTLTDSAPSEHGDHLVSLSREGQPEVFGVVRCDSVGRRLVAVALTAAEATTKAKPAIDRHAPEHIAAARSEAKVDPQAATMSKRAAEETMQSELADYRREVARVTGQAAKLI